MDVGRLWWILAARLKPHAVTISTVRALADFPAQAVEKPIVGVRMIGADPGWKGYSRIQPLEGRALSLAGLHTLTGHRGERHTCQNEHLLKEKRPCKKESEYGSTTKRR